MVKAYDEVVEGIERGDREGYEEWRKRAEKEEQGRMLGRKREESRKSEEKGKRREQSGRRRG